MAVTGVPDAIAALAVGGLALVHDEYGGVVVAAAGLVTGETVARLGELGRGLLCCAADGPRLDDLGIPPMAPGGEDPSLRVGVDLRDGGMSAAGRAATLRALADPGSTARSFRLPGHVFPVACRPYGVLERPAHAEAARDLARLAGLAPAAAFRLVTDADGGAAGVPRLRELAEVHGLPLVSIADLAAHRSRVEDLVERVTEARLPLLGKQFRVLGYRYRVDGGEHLALVLGDFATAVGVHAECLLGDAFGALGCDCGRRLEDTLARIAAAGAGVLVYLRRPRSLGEALRGADVHGVSAAEGQIAAQILRDLQRSAGKDSAEQRRP
ncbi:3,4-dihydroxy-2-butanone-4-phosphate synthase [Amycolatopsis sp. NPDC088138]|uniref:3,4-dihydroxy-2-butanone-4-phosphate synthase n=1 Tax=Amycolatopsis sp. NPDC088138 TaxID=3363938 RepID=UPI003809C4C2